MRGHAVAVQGEAPDNDIGCAVKIQYLVLAVINDAVAVRALPAGKTASAGGDLPVYDIDDIYFVFFIAVQALEKGFRKSKRIAFLFGAAVKYEYTHCFAAALDQPGGHFMERLPRRCM